MNLLSLLLCAASRPLVGLVDKRYRTFHAITIKAIGKGSHDWPETKSFESTCGLQVKVCYPPVWWAPKIRGTKYKRCEVCAAEHGNRVGQPPRWMRPK